MRCCNLFYLFFFFNDTATTEIYTLSLHDALPILARRHRLGAAIVVEAAAGLLAEPTGLDILHQQRARPVFGVDRKSTRLNSSHANISYAVFCLKKKKTK